TRELELAREHVISGQHGHLGLSAGRLRAAVRARYADRFAFPTHIPRLPSHRYTPPHPETRRQRQHTDCWEIREGGPRLAVDSEGGGRFEGGEQRLAGGGDVAIDHELLQAPLEAPHLTAWADPAYSHDLLSRDVRLHTGWPLRHHRRDPGLELVELLRFGVRRRGEVGAGQGEEAFELWTGIARQAPDGAVGPFGPVVNRPQVQAHEVDDRVDLLLREAKPLEGGPGHAGADLLMPGEGSVRGGGGRLADVVKQRAQAHDKLRRGLVDGEQRVPENVVRVVAALPDALASGQVRQDDLEKPAGIEELEREPRPAGN